MTFFGIIVIIAVGCAIDCLILILISIAKDSFILFKSYRIWKKMRIGDVYKYIGTAHKENPFERFSYTIRRTINDIREGWIQYTEEYIPESYTKPCTQVIRSERWAYVMSKRSLYTYKKIRNVNELP